MKSTCVKLEARTLLLRSESRTKIVSALSFLFQLFFIFSLCFCVYTIKHLRSFISVDRTLYEIILFYVLYVSGIIFSYCFIYIIKFNEKRWYLKNVTEPQRISSFFIPEKISTQIKVVFIATLKNIFTVCYLVFYLLPSTAVLFITLNTVNNEGMPKIIFMLTVVLFELFLIAGLFFWFVSIQKYSMLNEIIDRNHRLSVTEIINQSKKKTEGICFLLAKFKLSFVFWFAISLLIIPLIFVIPYYRQSFACICARKLGKKIQAHQPEPKPVILMHLSTEKV